MTTPFAELALLQKSASAEISLSPFAELDSFVKEAFFQDVKDSVWNNAVKPFGNALGQVGRGIGQVTQGLSEGYGNLIKTPMRAMGGALTGGLNAAMKGYQQNGRVDLGAIGQGAVDGGWNAGRDSLGWAANGAAKNLQGWGNVAGGAANTAFSMNPVTMAARGGYGLGQGLATGTENWINNKLQSFGGMMRPANSPMQQMGPPASAAPMPQMGPPAPTTQFPQMGPPASAAPMQQMGPPTPFASLQSPGAAPRPVAGVPSPTAYQGPTQADYQRTMGSYNPNSPFDQRKAQAIDQIWQQNGGRVSPNQVYADPRYAGLAKAGSAVTPFALCDPSWDTTEKAAATGIAGWLRSALTSGAKGLNRSSRMAKAIAGRGARAEANAAHKLQAGATSVASDLPALPSAREAFDTAYAGAGNARQGLANFMGNTGLRIDASPGLQKLINYGVPATALGGAFYGGNRMGHNSGMETGLSRGFDTGADYGIQTALANAPQDPGFFGRIADVFTGQQKGPQAVDMQALLDANKAQILQGMRNA